MHSRLKSFGRQFWFCALAMAVSQSARLQAAAQNPPGVDAYRKYALTHQGEAARGARFFSDEQRLACSRCHSIDGTASKAGPDLFAVGDAFGRRDIVDAILLPSATIAPGYGTVIVETKTGLEYQGTLKQATDAQIQLMGADAKLVTLARSDIKEQRGTAISLMPEGLHSGLSLQEFTDLIDYLVTLKQPVSTLVSNH